MSHTAQEPTVGDVRPIPVSSPAIEDVAHLRAELAARDKTIAVLIARIEGQLARSSSAIAVIEQNVSLEAQVKRRTRELEDSRDNLAHALAELKQAQSQLLEAGKLEAIGQLAAGIAHELNTPIQYVSDNTSFLSTAFGKLVHAFDLTVEFVEDVSVGERAPGAASLKEKLAPLKLDWLKGEVPRAFADTLEGLTRVSHIVSAMKKFSYPSADRKELVDLTEAIATTMTVARHEWKYLAEIETRFDEELPRVPCHRSELNQVILNLIVNAAHAIEEARGHHSDRKGHIAIGVALVGDEVELTVRDDGAGIPEEVAARIFEPFFTTKPVGKGTGQGLAMAWSVIVDKHGGTLRFESARGSGTCFFIRLPLHPPKEKGEHRAP
jgi:two-component system, NtrC family, sensor kinase